ncbi:AQG_2a_G0045020.mRNA.1.CDS.1 [Saccharomyces cerevisiae]|uniref:Restriction of telomere capping protein 4 n=1 Tax=Saccharomyces cerevisiae (strain YJM789) TaxID=307796 RepID=RTC4_YEAS7|nr:RecName: Full=Restriction of telomere capping protein 4 [Saccharomyces cerevisiae YJM789]AJT01899.1 Rtc4p [Saccharomyces cerevisiae YJM193]AJT02275.1 Rtc4p [Saccharomyces cerevisiae YJM195]AJT04137.1 Rtc4p [Saccharomyces cerevisiae YJM320]AJT04885.1 Rtc4p [Saccharomyces cerevisiae YJM428]AJT05637.1 Rtc4p [Saccharomyces cerevisiae YJM451]AJT06384.1 Rtc4p [Saccharomyces cerevisiae YJM456]AJT07121.1 Rtc4p [Saccharomyces cerevisiae YJM541]AJT07490.1 Rtc4p [Saccharomyces cerevisiae YJM554]AJ
MVGPGLGINQVRRKGVYSTKKGSGDNLLLMKRQGKHDIHDRESDDLSGHDAFSPSKKRGKIDSITEDEIEVKKLSTVATFDKLSRSFPNSEVQAAKNAALRGKEKEEEKVVSIPLIQNLKNEDIESIKCRNNNLLDGKKLLLEAELSAVEDNQIFSSSFPEDKKLSLQSCLSSKEQIIKKLQVREEYMSKFKLPPMLFSDELLTEVEPFMPIVMDILEGKISSAYYFEAKNAFKNSQKAYLSVDEFRKLNLNKFTAGFYGLKRQLRVGEEIAKRYKRALTHNQPATLKWWGITDFCNYVLAPETLTSFCIYQLNLSNKSCSSKTPNKHPKQQLNEKEYYYDPELRMLAYDLLEDTVEYGIIVADSDPIEQWEAAIEEDRLRELKLDVHNYSSRRWRLDTHD